MKKYLLAILLLAGCATGPKTTQQKLDDLSFWTYLAASTGAQYDLIVHPEHRVVFEKVAAEMQVLITNQKFDAITFHQLLSQLPVKELRERPEAAIFISTASILYSRYGKSIEINNDQLVGVTIVGIHNGIQNALDLTAK